MLQAIKDNLTKENLNKYDEEVTHLLQSLKTTNNARKIALITSGGTKVNLDLKEEYIIDNFATGWRGVYLVENFVAKGYLVIHLYRSSSHLPFERNYSEENEQNIKEYKAYQDKIKKYKNDIILVNYDYIFEYLYKLYKITYLLNHYEVKQRVVYCMAAAVSDFYVPLADMKESLDKGKETVELVLKQTPKMLGWTKTSSDKIKLIMVSFKLETDQSILHTKVVRSFNSSYSDFIIGNILSTRNKRLYVYRIVNGEPERIILEKEFEGKGILERKMVDYLEKAFDEDN